MLLMTRLVGLVCGVHFIRASPSDFLAGWIGVWSFRVVRGKIRRAAVVPSVAAGVRVAAAGGCGRSGAVAAVVGQGGVNGFGARRAARHGGLVLGRGRA